MTMPDRLGKCIYCGKQTKGLDLHWGSKVIHLGAPEVCSSPPCLAKNDDDYKRKLESQKMQDSRMRAEASVHKVPPIFADTDINRLPVELRPVAQGWHPLDHPSRHSLLLTGKPRCGKSRTAVYVAQRLCIEQSTDIEFLSMYDLERVIEDGIEGGSHSKNIRRLIHVGILILDDVGKEMMTKRVASDLFAIIDGRINYKRTTILTTQHTGESVASRFNDRTVGDAIVSRLREFYTVISTK